MQQVASDNASDNASDQNNKKRLYPFEHEGQWDLARRVLTPDPLSRKRQKLIVLEKYNRSIERGKGFKTMKEFDSCLAKLESKCGNFKKVRLTPGEAAPSWAPIQQDLWMRDTMTVLQHILGDIRFASAMKWGPEKLYNSDHQRVYSELWSGKWWWRKQVFLRLFVPL